MSNLFQKNIFQKNIGRLGNGFRPSDTVPLRPARMTHLEAAALEELAMLCRDAAIARCFGLTPAHLTRKRQTNKPSWDHFERRWLTEGPVIQAQTRKRQAARELARQHRLRQAAQEQRLREEAFEQRRRDAAAEAAIFHHGTLPAEAPAPSVPCSAVPLSAAERFGKRLLDIFSNARRLGWILLGIAAYLAFGLLYPGGWTAAWTDWLGVSR